MDRAEERDILVKTRDALACLINQIEDPDSGEWSIEIPEARKQWIANILDESTGYIDNH